MPFYWEMSQNTNSATRHLKFGYENNGGLQYMIMSTSY